MYYRNKKDRRLVLYSVYLSTELGAEELADLSGVALEGEREVHYVKDDRLDAVAPAFDLADHAGHLVPVTYT